MKRLMVQQNDRQALVKSGDDIGQRFTLPSRKARYASILAAGDVKAVIYEHGLVAKHGDSVFGKIFYRVLRPADVFVIAGDRVYPVLRPEALRVSRDSVLLRVPGPHRRYRRPEELRQVASR